MSNPARLDPMLVSAWSELFDFWQIGRITSRTAVESAASLIDNLASRYQGRVLDAVEIAILKRRSEMVVSNMFKQLDNQIRQNVEQSMRLTVKQQLRFLENRGYALPSTRRIEYLIKQRLERMIRGRFAGRTYLQRIGLLKARSLRMVQQHFQTGIPIESIVSNVRQTLTFSRPNLPYTRKFRSPQPGGSVRRQVEALDGGESTRATRDVTRDLYAEVGVELVYWRLHPDHRWEGGVEICERLAEQENAGAIESLQSRYMVADAAGLYRIDDVPSTPHPFCKCQLSPV